MRMRFPTCCTMAMPLDLPHARRIAGGDCRLSRGLRSPQQDVGCRIEQIDDLLDRIFMHGWSLAKVVVMAANAARPEYAFPR